jgi:hypothetical protein
MKRLLHQLPILWVLVLFGSPYGVMGEIKLGAPLKDFTIPGFGEDGFPSWVLKGKQLQHVDDTNALVQKMQLQILGGKGDRNVETDLFSPVAKVHLRDNRAEGDQSLRIVGGHFRITGQNWNWDGTSRTVEIQQRVKVTFNETLKFF